MILALLLATTYVVTPPVSATNCPAIQPGLANHCYYLALGEFTDTYQFPAEGVYAFEVTGNHWHQCVRSGRAHPCYTESMTIVDAMVIDSTGLVVLQLDNVAPDDWTGAVQLPPGDYMLVISGSVAGNRAGVYGYSIQVIP